MITSIATRDIENLLNLLCREEENMLPVKEIPESIPLEHQKVLREMREKIQTCYSIFKTLKLKFQQQRVTIKKAQERIQRLLSDKKTLEEESKNEKHEQEKTIEYLEEKNKESKEQKRHISTLQVS
jgi:hypothetical protein